MAMTCGVRLSTLQRKVCLHSKTHYSSAIRPVSATATGNLVSTRVRPSLTRPNSRTNETCRLRRTVHAEHRPRLKSLKPTHSRNHTERLSTSRILLCGLMSHDSRLTGSMMECKTDSQAVLLYTASNAVSQLWLTSLSLELTAWHSLDALGKSLANFLISRSSPLGSAPTSFFCPFQCLLTPRSFSSGSRSR